jgi:glycosyltransferase involved in cell wall biosynthesis
MMHLFLNGLAASAGGGLTYLRNLLPHLSLREGVQATVAVNPKLRQELSGLPRVALAELNCRAGTMSRFWQEQTSLPEVIRRSGADVLVSVGNFALYKSPVPQILLSRNSLYTSRDFMRDLLQRREYGLWLDTQIKGSLARRSIQWADRTVAPTEAFAKELREWTGREVVAIHHGFDRDTFFRDQTPLPEDMRQKLDREMETDALRLLYVSHYNYYRNFETLFRALPLMPERLGGRKLRLFLTCRLRSEDNPGSYSAEAASALVAQLGIADSVVELGAVPYSLLHYVYRACDMYVTPAYAESFAHPLVEAMASGLPIVASDLAVHREICEEAATYFTRFSPEDLAAKVCQVAASDALAEQLSRRGQERARAFSWDKHVNELLDLASNLLATIDPVRKPGAGSNDFSGRG